MTSFWAFVGVATSVAAALPWDGASPTDPVVAVESLGWTPISTQPQLSPYGGEMVPMPGRHIFARDPNDQVCGYRKGNFKNPVTCPNSLATCTTTSGVVACCDPDSTGISCEFATTCIGAVEQSSCGVGCLSNTHIRKCTDSTAPFCIKYTDSDLSGWGCMTSSGLTESFLVKEAITMARETTVESSPSSTVPSESKLSQPGVTGDSTKSNVGAVAGGVVGGLAVVVLGGVGLFLVLSHRKKNAAAAAVQGQTAYQPGAPPAEPMIQQPPMQPMHPGGYPDQNWNNQVYASAAQPQQQGYYAQQPQQPQQLEAPLPTQLSDGQ